jgi:hypothetical protein
MKAKITLITAAFLLASLVAPASARIDGDEGGASAYPRFNQERNVAPDQSVNRPFHRR